MNTAAPAPPAPAPGTLFPDADTAWFRVLKIQTKLHQRAGEDPSRRFDDLFNLVCDPAFLALAWDRVRGNKGARTAGVDGQTAFYVESVRGREVFLAELRAELKAGVFSPVPVRERMIPKTGGKLRRLGIPTVRDRVVQAALKLVLEPIFEADFKPCSYGFRPRRRTQDAIAEIHFLASAPRNYEWVLEADIEACFDNIDHTALLGRVRRRVGDKRVLGLVKAFCKAGILTEHGAAARALQDTSAGTPQGGILSPLLANIALSALDEHFTSAWEAMGDSSARHRRRRRGLPTYRLVRYADDFVVMVNGRGDVEAHLQALRLQVAAVLAPLGLRLSEAKTRTVHIEEGFEFLGFRIQRQPKRGSGKPTVYTYPARKALASITGKVKTISRQNLNQPLAVLLHRLAPVLRGWVNYFRHGTSKATFDYLRHYAWRRVVIWLRRKHPRATWKWLRRHHLPGWWPTDGATRLFDPMTVPVTRYRYRAANIPTPWQRPNAAPA
ncbi:group II intron reverse transcriptase/maturase [Pseudonocardia bannensis]|uniref:group II intron reverse transcriptase/maturase n=1 Tax=Pseudonocardia sp. H11422 TaxID=2835866 RepID=UPI0027E37293|nr:group II intron reverse transcriptase/maturase [Pseudonocardia sp. H11422]